ncbi:hypothetical protein K470DRAFT_259815 [Piedraia hortae CBS 480.64]|uniref:Nicotinamide N-methyltransferase n=1 Tax=Piedraia hortae CBS 480.64 TaxID=1314780 RepID=A0A6A7BT58_9PEZI|nr:hypothetical protein K470DRAFT_259815 [Piedraia hortae CBS 480.64]
MLWNAGRVLGKFLENHEELVQGKSVLELGAGAGLPSIICAMHNAEKVVATDYPDADLVENLQRNIETCLPKAAQSRICAKGYLWGNPLQDISIKGHQFNLMILADLLFNHSEHAKLLSTIQQSLKKVPEARALVFFTPHRPWLYGKDIDFFRLAKNGGFNVEKILEEVMPKAMFEDDPGVSAATFTWPHQTDLGRMNSCGGQCLVLVCNGGMKHATQQNRNEKPPNTDKAVKG